MNPLLFALIAVLVAGNTPSAELPTSTSQQIECDDEDFDRYQRGLISLNRRLDAIEATLGGLAALEIAVMTYMLEKATGDFVWTTAILTFMLTAIAVALLGVFGYGGDETPNLVEFDEERHRDRRRAIKGAVEAMTETYRFNRRQVRLKGYLRLISVSITASVGAVFALHVLEWMK